MKNDKRGWVTRFIDGWMFHDQSDLEYQDKMIDLLMDIRRAVTIGMLVLMFILARSCDGVR